MGAGSNIDVAFIDGAHDRFHVFYDTVQLFVNAGILSFRQTLGQKNWDLFWCRDGRPEAAVFDVLHDSSLRDRLHALHLSKRGFDKEGGIERNLNGSMWILHTDYPFALFTLYLAPRRSRLRRFQCKADVFDKHCGHEVDMGLVRLDGWKRAAVDPRWAPAALTAMLHGPNRSGGGMAQIVFDPMLQGFTYS